MERKRETQAQIPTEKETASRTARDREVRVRESVCYKAVEKKGKEKEREGRG